MIKSNMLGPNSRIGVAISGGMDSGVLLKILLLLKKKLPFKIEIMALHINPGFDTAHHLPLKKWIKKEGISAYFEINDMGPRAHSPENRTNSPCFFCSWRRRKRLFQLVKDFNLSHLAMGHTGDDLVSTFFINILYAGRVEGMYPCENFFKGEFKLIRPLLLLDKEKIYRAALSWKIPILENPCPSAKNSRRIRILEEIQKIWPEKKKRKNIYSALYNWILKNPSPKK